MMHRKTGRGNSWKPNLLIAFFDLGFTEHHFAPIFSIMSPVSFRYVNIAFIGQKALAYVTAKNHGLEEEAANIAEDLEELPALNPKAQLLHPPTPILRMDNWALLTVSKGFFENLAARTAQGESQVLIVQKLQHAEEGLQTSKIKEDRIWHQHWRRLCIHRIAREYWILPQDQRRHTDVE